MTYALRFDIVSYWHPGTGQGRGSHLDATTHRGRHGLPCLPGRTVKGLARDAVHRWESFGGYDTSAPGGVSVADRLFGPYGEEGRPTWPGLLRFSDASLPEADAAALESAPGLVDGLYRSQFSTAIEHDSGTAKEKTLRGIELIVPLTLWAAVDVVPVAAHRDLEKDEAWVAILRKALPLIQAVGAHRSRGLGRAVVTLEVAS